MLLDLSSREPGAPSVIPLSHHRVATEGSGFETPSDGFWRLGMTSLLLLLGLSGGGWEDLCLCLLSASGHMCQLFWGQTEWGGVR